MSRNQRETFLRWVSRGLFETAKYRLGQEAKAMRDEFTQRLQDRLGSKTRVLHFLLRYGLKFKGVQFIHRNQGDAPFGLLKLTLKPAAFSQKKSALFVPGIGDSPLSWVAPYAICEKALKKEGFSEFLSLDFPGFNGFLSDKTMVTSFDVMVSMVKSTIDTTRPSLMIGHSLGGWLIAKALESTQHKPDHVILIAPSGHVPENEREAFGQLILNQKNMPFEERVKWITRTNHRILKLFKKEFEGFFEKPEVEQFIKSITHDHFLKPEPLRTKRFTLIWGDEDQFVQYRWAKEWTRFEGNNPFFTFLTLNRVGHIPQLETPVKIAFMIKRVLSV